MSIRISEKHGVNPSLTVCPICGANVGIALLGLLKDDVEAPRHLLDDAPCEACQAELKEYKKMGFVLLVVANEAEKHPELSPWRFFRWLSVVKPEAMAIAAPKMDMSKGVAWISESVARALGVPMPPERKG